MIESLSIIIYREVVRRGGTDTLNALHAVKLVETPHSALSLTHRYICKSYRSMAIIME